MEPEDALGWCDRAPLETSLVCLEAIILWQNSISWWFRGGISICSWQAWDQEFLQKERFDSMSPSIHLYLSISIHVLGTQQQQVYDRHNGERLPPELTRFPLFDPHGVFMTRFYWLTSKRGQKQQSRCVKRVWSFHRRRPANIWRRVNEERRFFRVAVKDRVFAALPGFTQQRYMLRWFTNDSKSHIMCEIMFVSVL